MRIPKRGLFVALSILVSGCASTFMIGSKPHKGIPANVVASYVAPVCLSLADGTTVPGAADQTYYLVEGKKGPVLYELGQDGTGAKITNHWRDARGDHFLTYVKSNNGWEYVVPADRSLPAEKLVYTFGSFHVDDVEGVLMVTSGQPRVRCPLTSIAARPAARTPEAAPRPAAAAPAATPTGGPTAPVAGCSKDTECKGDRICEDGVCRSPK